MESWPALDGDGNVSRESIRAAGDAIRRGGVVALPTETFYGLAADPRRPAALERVSRLKGRPRGQPFLLLVDGVDRARRVAPDAPPLLERLAADFWPGPLTLVVPAPAGLHPMLVGEGGGVALRHPGHPVAVALVRQVDAPVTGTSANRSGAPAADRPGKLELNHQVELLAGVLDAGSTPGGTPSTLLDLTGSGPRILRAGAVDETRLREYLDV